MGDPATSLSNRVRAVFGDSTMLAFDLHRDVTFGQLAEHIGNLAEFHDGLSLPVHVRLARGTTPARRRRPGRRRVSRRGRRVPQPAFR